MLTSLLPILLFGAASVDGYLETRRQLEPSARIRNVGGGKIAAPQQITWMYANDLMTGANFLSSVLGLEEVKGLVQHEKCRIFQTSFSDTSFFGVCNTRRAPACAPAPESRGNDVPATYTFVVSDRSEVDRIFTSLKAMNGTELICSAPSGSASWGAYGFTFFDMNTENGLGCYRFEVQSFDDSAWLASTLEMRLQGQLRTAGDDIYASPPLKVPVDCECKDFCSGKCFAPSCTPCPSSIWTTEQDCLNPGPLGSGLLCLGESEPCCSPNGTVCTIGKQWCDCSAYAPQEPLFPPLAGRHFDNKTKKCF